MNLTLSSVFSLTAAGVEGSLWADPFPHVSRLVSGALFLCVGVLYDRHQSRMVKYYSGMAHYYASLCNYFRTFLYLC